MTWLQPPGFVHQMIADTWSSHALRVTVNGTEQTGVNAINATGVVLEAVSAAAQKSDDGKTLLLRVACVNASKIQLTIGGKSLPYLASNGRLLRVKQTTISSDDPKAGNWPDNPMAISPQTNEWMVGEHEVGAQSRSNWSLVELPGHSFTVFECSLG
jgi:hypothetical protein